MNMIEKIVHNNKLIEIIKKRKIRQRKNRDENLRIFYLILMKRDGRELKTT